MTEMDLIKKRIKIKKQLMEIFIEKHEIEMYFLNDKLLRLQAKDDYQIKFTLAASVSKIQKEAAQKNKEVKALVNLIEESGLENPYTPKTIENLALWNIQLKKIAEYLIESGVEVGENEDNDFKE